LNIVIDSNILFSALIKDSVTRGLILLYKGEFLFPSFIFEELEKHKDELLQKSKMKPEHFNVLVFLLLQKMRIVPADILQPYRKVAYETVKHIDPNDSIFIACALAYPYGILWSDDKKLKEQHLIPVINTKEMYLLFYGGL
jgi:predicted nucleic acid-binding protein